MPSKKVSKRGALVIALVAVVAAAGLAFLLGGKGQGSSAASSATAASTSSKASGGAYSTGTHHATIVVKDYGTIQVELYAGVAPITVANFAKLVEQGFYDGLTFHRVISGFMIQGGDPKGNGTGGSGQTIKGEFSANGVANPIKQERGTISMARSSGYDSASSQFFIMQRTNASIDGQYAGFGHVTSGMEVVDAICEKVPTTDSNGTVAKESQPVIESIRMVD
ncbi:MAG: peptidylprolyl isomerase [Atopobiaceae bacterium]|nr:peptidylprolyl isomerase [Atopobiaceae bacterium]